MCIVIDANAIAYVFNPKNSKHRSFKPVLDWIVYGKGKVVYGGTKYKKELARASSYLKLILELIKIRKLVEINGKLIDRAEHEIKQRVKSKNLDDPHIIAIFIVSSCRLFCSADKRADRFVQDSSFYPKKHKMPKIYRGLKHRHLLCEKNIVSLKNIV
jgi:predicted nucleic acid-binding protein